MNVMAGIVTYNPNLSRLVENLSSLKGQVTKVIVVDNHSENLNDIVDLLEAFPEVTFVRHDKNLGIAVALNRAMSWASARGGDWALLLDQDSVCTPGMVSELSRLVSPEVAIVAPAIFDRNISEIPKSNSEASEVNFCITSGGIYSVTKWAEVGGYDETMFMDFVDFDFCLRLRVAGFQIRRNPAAILVHEIGSSVRRGPFISYNHSASRSYHIAKDMVYYAKKNQKAPRELTVHGRGILFTYLLIFRKALIIAAFEEDSVRRIAALVRGCFAGTFPNLRHNK